MPIPTTPSLYSSPTAPGNIYEVSAGPYRTGELRVLSFDGKEEMNGLYAFDVLVWGKDIDEGQIEAEVLGRAVTLTMHVSESAARCVRGIVAGLAILGKHPGGRNTYRLNLVPRLWLLDRRVNSRIFQDKTVQQIVDLILDEHDIAREWKILAQYPQRQYCVQYQESDYHFLRRLLAEEGIFFFFDQPLEGSDALATERVVFGDSAHTYPPINGDPGLRFRQQIGDGAMSADEDHVLDFRVSTRVESSAVVLRDYDFKRPLLNLTSGGPSVADDALDPSPIQRISAPTPGIRPLEVYEHHGEYEETDADKKNAEVYLEQLRSGVREAQAVSVCRRLLPGHRFTLADHDLNTLNASYVVTHIEHHGVSGESATKSERVYENRFRGVPVVVPFRPPRPARVLRQVVESAVVVGPAGQDIYTDPFGRIKVQFHWDREGKRDEHSSCWMRVAQVWSGSGWGFQFIPRVGMEVLVSFLGGDEDRPVVTGCLNNAINTPSQLLPSKMTRSGIRTRTTPGGGGFNELTFDDRAGEEQVLLRAQRRLDEVIVGDHSISVGGEERASTSGSRTEGVGGDVVLTVDGQRTEAIAGNHNEQIGGNFDSVVIGEQRTSVMGDASAEVSGNSTLTVRGNHHVLVGHGEDEGHSLLYVNGDYTVGVSQELALSAKKAITLSVGESSIEITAEGIKLKGKSISIEGADGASLKVKGNELKMDEKLSLSSDLVELFSTKGSIVMDEEVHIDGKLVNLNCKPKAPDPAKEQEKLPEEGIVTFRVKRKADGSVPSGVIMIIGTPLGEVIEKEADEEGKVEIKGKKGERFVLIGVRQGDHVFGHQSS